MRPSSCHHRREISCHSDCLLQVRDRMHTCQWTGYRVIARLVNFCLSVRQHCAFSFQSVSLQSSSCPGKKQGHYVWTARQVRDSEGAAGTYTLLLRPSFPHEDNGRLGHQPHLQATEVEVCHADSNLQRSDVAVERRMQRRCTLLRKQTPPAQSL